MNKLKGFKLAYLIFLAVCILLSTIFLIYVHCVIKAYDKAQPERLVESKIEWLSSAAEDGTLAEKVGIAELCNNPYENNDADAYAKAYSELISGAELTYEFVASQSGDLLKAYNILAGDKRVGTIRLTGENSRTSLFFFSMADWSVAAFEPMISDTVYNLTVYCPDNIKVFINDTQLVGGTASEGETVPSYAVKGLLNEPVIRYEGADGEIPYTSDNNIIKPAVYNYQITVPQGIKVAMNGQTLSGQTAEDGQLIYSIRDMTEPKVSFTDSCGDTYTFLGGDDVTFYPYTVILPAGYGLEINGMPAESICTVQETAHPDAQQLLDKAGVKLPDLKTYSFTLLTGDAVAVVTEEDGTKSDYILSDLKLEISTLSTGDTIPEDIAAQVDVMEIAKDWSRFMTDDLGGELHGVYKVYDFLIKDSDYYRYAYEWATGIDITFTSTHTLDSFTNEKISNFIQYNDNCFSCEVYFEKNMSLYRGSTYVGARTDVFHSIMYFLYTDDTPDNGVDDPHWAIAVMHDVL